MKKIVLFFLLTSCANMSTEPEHVKASYVSPQKYANFDCKMLVSEYGGLKQHEKVLVDAQRRRVDDSYSQALMFGGIGKGDGVEAFELASVRGQIIAVKKNYESKNCMKVSSK
ncbi:hypothetical protein ABMA70_01590 [Halobacteriovorax sp. XZX-3]|uniref:hypothetical protein n=1 Tax=unclassified Halobacteriovorax TaxID=2639665 RepID=UPI003712EFD8